MTRFWVRCKIWTLLQAWITYWSSILVLVHLSDLRCFASIRGWEELMVSGHIASENAWRFLTTSPRSARHHHFWTRCSSTRESRNGFRLSRQVSFSANGCLLSTTCFKLLFTIQCFLHFYLVEISLNFQGDQPSWSEAGITGQSFVIGGKTLLPAGPNATTASCPDFSKHFFVSV